MKTITLANLATATAQEVFDHIVSHLRDQNEQSVIEEGSNSGCKYRYVTTTGKILRCAAGCLIADNEYREEFDKPKYPYEKGTSWPSIVRRFNLPTIHTYLIFDLQKVHDNYEVELWELEFKHVAKSHGLKYTEK
jgi:hypothetical protein